MDRITMLVKDKTKQTQVHDGYSPQYPGKRCSREETLMRLMAKGSLGVLSRALGWKLRHRWFMLQ
ncbi:unnamed protein product [Ilex paraguariensis]|uniref:Uncharacterized protein n=1 Tax=Ilex paraguariensis TaxID=185542 RepID=A0ABC8RA36_9AQUA